MALMRGIRGDVKVYETAKIAETARVYAPYKRPSRAMIGDFCLIAAKVYMRLGAEIHAHTDVVGGGVLRMGEYSSLGYGVRVFTRSNMPTGTMTDSGVNDGLRFEIRDEAVVLGRHASVQANSVVMPGARVPAGCVVGAGAYVDKGTKLREWYIYHPSCSLAGRPRERFV